MGWVRYWASLVRRTGMLCWLRVRVASPILGRAVVSDFEQDLNQDEEERWAGR